jgi:acetoin:2,6-dichlorophenolindophenol oxidoreductase subunit beta
MANGGGLGFGAQHSQSVENWFLNIPGLKIVVPGTASDAYGLLRAAIQDPDPVLYFEHKGLFNAKGTLTGELVPLGQAEIARPGRDASIVATQLMRARALEAAERLAAEGIDIEVIDPRTLVPLDFETIAESVERTNRLIVVQECSYGGSWGATLAARIATERFDSLDAPSIVIGGDETPIPYAGPLEDAWIPSVDRIAAGVRGAL